MNAGLCKACGADIVWARTVNDRPIPLDRVPNPKGNVEVVDGVAHVHSGADLFSAQRFMPHHATCPSWSTP